MLNIPLLALFAVCISSPAVAQFQWNLHAGPSPAGRARGAAAFDALRGEGVIFGGGLAGASAGPFSAETWIWDGAWQQRSPATTPAARNGQVMAFDAARGQVLMFGGSATGDGSSPFGDTWIWNGSDWTQLFPATAPSPRAFTACAYDPVRQVIVLFGGLVAGNPNSETWEWNGQTWTQLFPSPGPASRRHHRMTFDGNSQQVALIGGWGLVDHWSWNGSAWTNRGNYTTTPTGGMVADHVPSTGRIIVFGGTTVTSIIDSQREHDGSTWSLTNPSGRPGPRTEPVSFYDSWRGQWIVFGGWDLNPMPLAHTWIYDDPSQANVVTFLGGCTGPSGVPMISVANPPRIGQNYQLTFSNVDPMSLPILVSGWSMTNLNLGTVSPHAHPGCFLGASPDLLELVLGISSYSLPIPNTPNLVGLVVHQQLVQAELNASFELVGMSSSNAIRAQFGN